MNLCLSLITQGHEDTAFLILRTFPTLQSDDSNADSANLGNFFLRHCVNMDTVHENKTPIALPIQSQETHTNIHSLTALTDHMYKISLCLLANVHWAKSCSCQCINVIFLISLCALQSMEKVSHYCKELQDSNLHSAPLSFSLSCALESKKTGTAQTLIYLPRSFSSTCVFIHCFSLVFCLNSINVRTDV